MNQSLTEANTGDSYLVKVRRTRELGSCSRDLCRTSTQCLRKAGLFRLAYCEGLILNAAVMETRTIELSPVSPETLSNVRADAISVIETALEEANKQSLQASGEIQITKVDHFPDPTIQIVIIIIQLASGIALETYKTVILPKLKERFEVKEKRDSNTSQG